MEKQATATQIAYTSMHCIEGLQNAINDHDLDALTECFEPDYMSTFPVHPNRAFRGRAQMRKNWSTIFGAVPDIHAELLRWASEGDTVWAEWEWTGTRVDGVPYLWRGVTIHGVLEGRTAWVRMYMEPVQQVDSGVDAAVQQSLSEQAATGNLALGTHNN